MKWRRQISKFILQKIDGITDIQGTPIDKSIKPIVAALHELGIQTTGSCHGHLDHGCPYPWVDIEWEHFDRPLNVDLYGKINDFSPNEFGSRQKLASEINGKLSTRISYLLNDFYSSKHDRRLILEPYGIYGAVRLRAIDGITLKNGRSEMDCFARYLFKIIESE